MFARLKEAAERYRALEASIQDPALHAQPGRLAAALREAGLAEAAEAVFQDEDHGSVIAAALTRGLGFAVPASE